ncbi:MAG: metalloregulator ArsR/SmtB family transcription factor [Phycisphaeraceae bacterium]|nr:ArsR family transcriptional regulator [Phycisphaerales bacterium]MCB9843430.1 metalloregulator ArsR/SmtB family transcription factor [Phycisphaeraceae bacterium]
MKELASTNKSADLLSAIAEPIRMRIGRLLEMHELTVGEVAKVVQLPQSTVSRHLKVLADAGWIVRRTEGTAAYYQLTLDDLVPVARTIWLAIRPTSEAEPEVAEDARRLESVLAERPMDSKSYFGRVAGAWDKVRSELFGRDFTARAMCSLLPRHWVVADLGCGAGNGAELIAPFVKAVIGVDESDAMLSAAKRRLSGLGNVRLEKGRIESLPIRDGEVNAALCILVLHHLSEPSGAIREMRRILRPGGMAAVIDMYEHSRTIYRHTMGHQHLGFSETRIKELFSDAGLVDITVSPIPSDPDSKGPGLFVATGHAPD